MEYAKQMEQLLSLLTSCQTFKNTGVDDLKALASLTAHDFKILRIRRHPSS
jgi:hypothetical protein